MNNVQSQITVLLADDHPTIRAGLSETSDIRVVGEAEDGFQVETLTAKLRPNILLLDPAIPGFTLADLENWIHENHPEPLILILTADDHDAYLASMMDAGAVGFLSKTETGERLISAIRQAMNGAQAFTEDQFVRANRWRQEAGEKLEKLTHREGEVVRLIVKGYGNKQIAEKLNITAKTAAFHVTNILKKLDVKSRHEAIAWAHKYLSDNLKQLPA